MKTTVATRFRCSCPLINLFEKTLMFTTLISQYLNKLVEGKVGDFTSPQPFHAIKVQSFNDNRVKLLTEFAGELPMKVFALVADFPIETRDLSHTLPPAVRTFDFTTQCFVERPKFLQGVFQGLGVLYLFTRAQCQIGIFHAKVCPNAFTCCRQRSKIGVGRCYTDPISPASITLNRDSANSPMPLAVLVKCIGYPIKLPLACFRIPLTKSQCNTVIKQRPTRTSGIRHRLKLMSRLNMRSTTEFFRETIISVINTLEFLLHSLAWQCLPMRVCGLFQMFKVITHVLIVYRRQPVFMPLTLPFMEVKMHLPHIVKHITDTNRIRPIIKRIFIGFHGISHITPLSSTK